MESEQAWKGPEEGSLPLAHSCLLAMSSVVVQCLSLFLLFTAANAAGLDTCSMTSFNLNFLLKVPSPDRVAESGDLAC